MVEDRDDDLAGIDLVVGEIFKMGEMRDVGAVAFFRGETEGSGEHSCASGAVDQPLRMLIGSETGFRQRFGLEFQLPIRAIAFLEDRAVINEPHSEFDGPITEQPVELRAGDIVGVAGRVFPPISEAEMDLRAGAVEEGGSGLVGGQLAHSVLDPELAQHRNHRRDQRLANDQLGAFVIIENQNIHSALRQQAG